MRVIFLIMLILQITFAGSFNKSNKVMLENYTIALNKNKETINWIINNGYDGKDRYLLAAIAWVESEFDNKCVYYNCYGLLQLHMSSLYNYNKDNKLGLTNKQLIKRATSSLKFNRDVAVWELAYWKKMKSNKGEISNKSLLRYYNGGNKAFKLSRTDGYANEVLRREKFLINYYKGIL